MKQSPNTTQVRLNRVSPGCCILAQIANRLRCGPDTQLVTLAGAARRERTLSGIPDGLPQDQD